MILVLNIFWKFKTKMMILILNKCHYQETIFITKKKSKEKAQQEAQGEVQNQ